MVDLFGEVSRKSADVNLLHPLNSHVYSTVLHTFTLFRLNRGQPW